MENPQGLILHFVKRVWEEAKSCQKNIWKEKEDNTTLFIYLFLKMSGTKSASS